MPDKIAASDYWIDRLDLEPEELGQEVDSEEEVEELEGTEEGELSGLSWEELRNNPEAANAYFEESQQKKKELAGKEDLSAEEYQKWKLMKTLERKDSEAAQKMASELRQELEGSDIEKLAEKIVENLGDSDSVEELEADFEIEELRAISGEEVNESVIHTGKDANIEERI